MNIHSNGTAADADPRDRTLRQLMEDRALYAVYQPILDLRQGRHFACEALIRGPADSALHTPAALFAAAAAEQCTHELEWLAVETAILQFAEQRCALRLFVNMSIGCLHASRQRLVAIRQDLLRLGVPPSRIVIELTENQSVTDFSDLQETLRDFRHIGIQIAMDDMGEGFSNLRMWSEVRPEFVKIDRHFVRAMHEIADACGSALIAEGVETKEQLEVLRDLGIPYLQGFGIARPHRVIAAAPATHPVAANDNILVLPARSRAERRMPRIDQLLHEVMPVSPDTDNDAVYSIFAHQPALSTVPVVSNGTPLGMITRSSLIDRFARFVAAYCDLDHFKPYNDAYGYRRGDRMIQQVGTLLAEAVADHKDFVGHVGGDDFVVLLQSSDWEARLRRVIAEFDAALAQHMTAEHLLAGGYFGEDRRGQAVFHPTPALSIGCVMVQPGAFAAHYDVSAALSDAKKEAKRIPGSVLFVERRQYHGNAGAPMPTPMPALEVGAAVAPAPTSAARLPCWAM